MFPRWQSGRRPNFSAGGWNAAMAAAEAYQRSQQGGVEGSGRSAGLNRTIINVRNMSGSQVQRSQILGLGDFSFDPSDDNQLEELHEFLCLEGETPATPDHDDKWVVLPSELAEEEIGQAVLMGLVLVQVDIQSASHKFATIVDGDTEKLKSSTLGRGRIIKAETGTGTKWALVELGSQGGSGSTGFYVTNGSLSHGSSVTVERIRRNSGGTGWERSGETLTAYDIFLNTADTVDADTVVTVVPYEGLQVIESIYCAANDWGL